jgi:hypothetical protein
VGEREREEREMLVIHDLTIFRKVTAERWIRNVNREKITYHLLDTSRMPNVQASMSG